MAIGNRGSIVVDVQAQITGYNESIERMKKALDEIDPGSSIGKKLSKGIAAAEKELSNLGRESMKRISSQGELDRLNDKLLKVGNLITDLGSGFQQVSWKDLTSGAAQELRDLEKQVNDVRQATQNIVGDGFSKLITEAPELKKVFDELKIDPNKIGLNTIQQKFTQTLEGLEKQIKDFEQKIDKSKSKTTEYQAAIDTKDRILKSNLGAYTVGKSNSDAYKLFQASSHQQEVFGKKAEQIPAYSILSKEYIDEVKNLGETILTNLGMDPARQNNPELLAQLRPQIEAKIQQLLEAQSADAIKSILDDIDNSLKLQEGSGFSVQGKRLKGLTGVTGRGSASSIITERLTSLMTTSKINPEAFNSTKDFMRNALDQLKTEGNYDTSGIDKLLDSILPSLSEKEIKTRFEIVAKAIVDGARKIKEAGEKAGEQLPKEQQALNDLIAGQDILKGKHEQISQAQQKVDPLITKLQNTINNQEARIKSLEEQIRQLTEANTGKENPFQAFGAEEIENTAAQMEAAAQAATQYQHKLEQIQSLQQGLNNLQSFAQRWFSVYGAMRLVSNAFKSIKTNIKELDDIMTEIAIVTDMSQADLWQQMPQYISLAKEYAASLKGVYEVSQLYYQQGLQQNDVMAMTEETLKMARISGLSYSQATDYMTNAVRSFRMEMTESQRVVDVYSALAASSATSTTELATAMSKTASSAQAVGSSFENTTAMMAVMIEATREAPENIGTAMKSIISRYGEMTTNPAKLVDAEGEEMSLNKVDKALQTVGISIHDAQGQFRDFDDVIMELAASWDTIDKNTQRYIATVMAGNRQQSRFLALVSNYERLVELSDEAANSEDAATLQVMKTMDSVSAKAQQLQTSLQSMYTQTGLEEFYKGILDFTNGIIATFTQMPTIFKLPIPAILAFGQMFINVGTSLASVIKMLRDKLSTASAATEKEMTIAQQIAGKERITAEEKVWLERVQTAKKGAEQINGIERGLADTTNQVTNQRMGAAQTTVAVTPTVDFSSIQNGEARNALMRAYQNQKPLDKNLGLTSEDLAKTGLKLNEAGIPVKLQEVSDAAEDASKKTQGLWASLQQNKAAIIGLRMVGSSISLMAASMGEATDSARALKGGLQLLGGAMQAVSYAAMKNPYMAIFTGVMTAVQVLSTWIETDAERLERLNKKADESNTNYLQKKQDYKNLDDQIKKLKELEKAQYDSEEAQQAYIEASNELAETHPEMIAGLDAEGNAVIDLADTYGVLTKAKEEATAAAEQAAKDSIARAEEIENQAEERRTTQESNQWGNFYDDLPKITNDPIEQVYNQLEEQLKKTYNIETLEKFLKNLDNPNYSGWADIANRIEDSDLQASFVESVYLRRQLSSPGIRTTTGIDSNYLKSLYENVEDTTIKNILDPLMELISSQDTEGIKEYYKANAKSIKEIHDDEENGLTDAARSMLSHIAELNGGFLDIDSSIQQASNATKAVARSSMSTLASIQLMDAEGNDGLNAFYHEMEGASTLVSDYLMNMAERFADQNEGKSYSDYMSDPQFFDDLGTLRDVLGQTWKEISQSAKNEINDLIKNRGKYTDSQIREQLIDSLGWNENKLVDEQKDLLEIFTGGYNFEDASNAIKKRISKQKIGKQLSSGGFLASEGQLELGSDELQTYINTYDNIASMLEQDKISLSAANQAMKNYYKLWGATKGDETAQALVNEFDDFSLAGLDEFRKSVKESLLNKETQDALIQAAEDLVNGMPINLETEFQTFSKKISSNMADFEKAISNASKGMDMKDALELAGKMDTTLDSFDLNNGKFFYTNLNDIKDAYFKGTSQYLEELNTKYDEEISKLKSDIRQRRREGVDTAELKKQLSEAETNKKVINDKFEEYTNYQLNSVLIQTGQIRLFLENILGQGSPDIDAQLSHINKGEYDQLTPEIQPYIAELYNYVNKIQKDIFDKAINSISGEGPQMVDATYATDAQKEILNILGKEVSPGQYLIDLSLKDIQEVQEQIKNAVKSGVITVKQGRSYLTELHNVNYEDNIYSALNDVVGNFENISYEAAQSLSQATGQELQFKTNVDGTLKGSYEQMSKLLIQNISKMTMKEYNDLRAKLEASHNKTDNEKVFADIIKNRDSLGEEQVANLANLLGQGYSATQKMLRDNGNGTYSLDLAQIETIIQSGLITLNDELRQLIANEIDTIITSLNGLGDIQSEGTTKIADMQKQVAEINKLSGQNYTMQDLFTYSDTLHGFVYSSQGLVESARQMKEQLETLSGDERWAAEQMLENTRNTFLQNIDITGFLNAERITPQIEENLRNSIIALNQYYYALGQTTRFTSLTIIDELKKGGAQAVAITNAWAQAQGKELSASDVEAAYRREVKSLVDAIDTITSGAGALVDETTANLINVAGGKATELAGTGQYIVESAANLYDAYNELLNRLKDTGEATLADINKVAALALENKDGEQQAIDALGDAAGMTYTRFGEILAQAGYELSEELISQLTSAGIVKQLGGSKMQIADFSAFADLMGWDAGSEEYVSAFKSYNDSLIEMNRKAEKNILEEAKNLENAKAGDQFNLTQLSDTLQKSFEATVDAATSGLRGADRQEALNSIYNPLDVLSNKLQEYGAELQNGILTIGADANLPAIIQEISNAAQQYGGLLSSEMAELADVLANVLKNYAELIQNGIKGTLTNVQADELKDLGKQLGVEVDFTKTKDGLKATQQSAIQLYNELKKIDALQGQITLETLADSLEASNENYANVSTIAKRIADLQREIDNPNISSARRQEYEAELAVAEEIYRVRSSTDNKSFDFMNRDLPNGMQNPIDYWNSAGEAYKAMNQAAESGYMEIQDFYNIVNEMNNMAAVSGNTLSFMGQTLSGKAEDAAALIEAGMGALKNVDGEGVKIALSSLGTDFATGAADMTGDFDTGIKEMAKSQIKMLDAAIRMLEAMAAMENIDVNDDGAFDLGEIFTNGADSSGGFTQPVMDWLRQIDIATGGIQVGAQSLQQALLELGKVNPDAVVAVMNQLKNIDWTLGDVNTFAQIQNVLSTFFPGVQISQMGPSVFDLLDIPSDVNEKTVQFQDFIKKTGLGVKEAQGVIQAIQNGILKPMSGKYGEHLGAKKGSDVYSAIESMLGLDKKGKKTFESFAGNYLTEDELQMWSKINIDYKKNGSIGSAIYTASDGSTHILDPKNVTGWQSEIEKIEDTIFKQQQTGQKDVSNVEESEPVTLESGFTVKGLIEAKDGGVDAWYNGTYLGNFPDKAAAQDAIDAEALKRDKEARGIGNKTVITPEGTIETKADFTRKATLSAEETQENKNFEQEVGQVYKEDADKINSLFQKGGQWEDYLKTNENGERTLELPGFESIKLADDQNPADLIKQLGEDLFGSPDQFAEIPEKIAEGIKQAFEGDAGTKIGEAISKGIKEAFGQGGENGVDEQAIPIDNITVKPTKITIDASGATPTITGLDTTESPINIPVNVTGNYSTILTDNGDGTYTLKTSDGQTITINSLVEIPESLYKDGEGYTIKTKAGNTITVPAGLGTVTDLILSDGAYTIITKDGRAITIGVNCDVSSFEGGPSEGGYTIKTKAGQTINVDASVGTLAGLDGDPKSGYTIITTSGEAISVPAEVGQTTNLTKTDSGYTIALATGQTISVTANADGASAVWQTWLDTWSKNSKIKVTPEVENPPGGNGSPLGPTTSDTRYAIAAERLRNPTPENNIIVDDKFDAARNMGGRGAVMAYVQSMDDLVKSGKSLSAIDLSNLEYIKTVFSGGLQPESIEGIDKIIALSQINEAEGMENLINSIQVFSGLELGDLPLIATAIEKIASAAERLNGISWDLIADGIKKVAAANTKPGEGPDNPTPADTPQGKNPATGESGAPITGDVEVNAKDAVLDNLTVDVPDLTMETSTVTINAGNVTIGGKENTDDNSDNPKVPQENATLDQPKDADSGSSQELLSFTFAVDETSNSALEATSKVEQLAQATDEIKDRSGAVKNTADAINKLKSKTVTVSVQTPDPPPELKVKASIDVEVNGDSPAKGNVKVEGDIPSTPKEISLKTKTSSRAKGNVALSKGTLMGELGPELVVTGGRYYTVGNNGTEFVNLPNDAIVFNHLQTERLFGDKKIKGRGKPVTNAREATSFATGNVNGPAMASASATLSQLRAIRAQWQALLDASAKDLGSMAGRGGGGGGGGGGGDGSQPTTTTAEIQRWYNWLRQIEKIEADISYQEKLQKQYETDRITNGKEIFKTQKQQLELLDQEIVRNQKLADLQKSWYDNKRQELAESSYGLIFTYDENGLQQYTGNDRPGSGVGLDILENLTRRDVNGQAKDNAKTAKKQLKYLQSVGFNLTDLLYNDDGTKVAKAINKNLKLTKIKGDEDDNDLYTQMMENFWNNVDAWRDELDSLYDSYHEQLEKIIDNQTKQNEIRQQWVDNQISIENDLMKAVENLHQDAIDKLEEQKDALKDSSDKFLEGLNDQLSKEKEMYERNNKDNELTKLQRQLAILQRSGGSASQIRSLQEQIASKQQDAYFDAQQTQIDAIQEASDKQIERLETQIDLMNDVLEYQKENGLLWSEVYEIMRGGTSDIVAFLKKWDEEYIGNSAIQQEETERDWAERSQQYDEFKNYQNEERDLNDLKADAEKKNEKYFNSIKDDKVRADIKTIAENNAAAAYKNAINEGKSEQEAQEAYNAAYNKYMIDNSDQGNEEIKAARESFSKFYADQQLRKSAGKSSVINDAFEANLPDFEEAFINEYIETQNVNDSVKAGQKVLESIQEKNNDKIEGSVKEQINKIRVGDMSKTADFTIGTDTALNFVNAKMWNKKKYLQFEYQGQSGWVQTNKINGGDDIYRRLANRENLSSSINYLSKNNFGKDIEDFTYTLADNTKLKETSRVATDNSQAVIKKGAKITISDIQGKFDKNGKIQDDFKIQISKVDEKELKTKTSLFSARSKLSSKDFKALKALINSRISTYATGGMADFTGPAWLDGTKKKPESVLNAAQTSFLKNDLLGNKKTSLMSIVAQLQDTFGNTATGISSNTTDDSVAIENISINFNTGTISNDYDARRAGDMVKEEILKIARKSGKMSITRG